MQSDISLHERKKLIDIGKKVQQLRKERANIGYENFAKLLSINKNTYMRIEKAQGNYTLLHLLRIISYYDLSLEEFFKDL